MQTDQDLIERIKRIRLLVLDVDGVMTDGRLIIGDDGQEYKNFHARDGLGMSMLRKSGVDIAIITARTSNVVKKRATELGIEHLYQGRREKLPAYRELCEAMSLSTTETAFMGDDLIDLSIMSRAGLAFSVSDGHPHVHKYAHWISSKRGGRGAVREACELIMQCQGTLAQALDDFLQPGH